MKQALLTFALLLATLTACAQDDATDSTHGAVVTRHIGMQTVAGKWMKMTQDADPLKGIDGDTVYVCEAAEMGSLVIWNWNDFQFRLAGDYQFAIEHVGYSTGLVAKVGFFDEDGHMTDSYRIWLDYEQDRGHRYVRTRDRGTMANPVGQKGKVRQLFRALRSGSGYVRIVAPRYDRTEFDIKVYPFKD